MLKLLKQVELYTPFHEGIKDVLIAGDKVMTIADTITARGVDCEIIDCNGKKAIPGLIDNHVHLLGGGGEAGPQSRVPEITLDELTKAGITTVIGLLGTDGYTRSMENLVAKARGLKAEGMSVYVLSGSYQLPVKTLTGSLEKDILYVDEIIGAGEIAISDHRSVSPTQSELKRCLSNAHVAGLLAGKAGVTNIHVGSGKAGLKPLISALEDSDIPPSKVLPTHINRNETLLDEGIAYSKHFGAAIDFTTYSHKDDAMSAYRVFKRALESGVDLKNITFSSDGQGSLPAFDAKGTFLKMGIGSVSSLFDNMVKSVTESGLSLEQALHPLTVNVADIFKLKDKGRIAEGLHADIVLIDDAYEIRDVFLRGRHALRNGKPLMKGTFSDN